MNHTKRSISRKLIPFVALQVGEIMRQGAPVLSPRTSLRDLGLLFLRSGICDSYPVVEQQQVVGIVSKRDFLRHFRFSTRTIMPHYEELLEDPVESIVNREVTFLSPQTPVTRALALLLTQGVSCLPVVDPEGRFLGVVSQDEVIDALTRLSRGFYSNLEIPHSKIA